MTILARPHVSRHEDAHAGTIGQVLERYVEFVVPQEALGDLVEGLPGRTPADALLLVASLDLFAWLEISEDPTLRIRSESGQEIHDFLVDRHVEQYARLSGPEVDRDAIRAALVANAATLLRIWNESPDDRRLRTMNVGREAWFMMAGRQQHPPVRPVVLVVSKLLALQGALRDFAKDVEASE